MSALDWFVIGYCIASSNSVWEVRSPKYCEQLFMGLRLGHKQGTNSGNGTIGSVHVGGYWYENVMILSQLQPYAKTVRKIELVEQTRDVTHVGMSKRKSTNVKFSANYPMLEVLTMKGAEASSFSSILSFVIEQNNLHTLSMTNCKIFITSLIDYLQSPHCSLHRLVLFRCTTLSNPDGLIIPLFSTDVALHSLDISCSVLDQLMSCNINTLTQSLTEMFLHVDNDTRTCTSGVETILHEIPSNCPLLKTLKIFCDFHVSLPLSIPQLIGSQQNYLQNLSLRWCSLNSDVTRSLIYSLHSPHCMVHELVIDQCTIPSTDHTQLVTAIVSSTTISFLFFSIDMLIDTWSLAALASGLRHNVTLETLVIDKLDSGFTEDQFRVLVAAVDSSAVNKLRLPTYYKQWLSDCPISRTNISIECYDSMNMLRVFSISSLSMVQGQVSCCSHVLLYQVHATGLFLYRMKMKPYSQWTWSQHHSVSS